MAEKKQVGLFFGSFNPIHVGHLIIANTVLQETELDQIWFVVSPQSPFKKQASLLAQAQRLDLVRTAIDKEDKLRATDVEFSMPKPSYTVDTLSYLSEKHGERYQFNLIMGSDNLVNFHKWKNYEQILDRHHIYAYERPGIEKSDFHNHKQVTIVNGPLLHISASMIRKYISKGKSVKFMVTSPVLHIIEKYNFYK